MFATTPLQLTGARRASCCLAAAVNHVGGRESRALARCHTFTAHPQQASATQPTMYACVCVCVRACVIVCVVVCLVNRSWGGKGLPLPRDAHAHGCVSVVSVVPNCLETRKRSHGARVSREGITRGGAVRCGSRLEPISVLCASLPCRLFTLSHQKETFLLRLHPHRHDGSMGDARDEERGPGVFVLNFCSAALSL